MERLYSSHLRLGDASRGTLCGGRMGRNTVLVIDDAKDLIELVRVNLEKNGFDVLAASDGRSGLAIAADHAPDVILLDLMMPGMDGLEVCRHIRNDPRIRHIPIIMLTARAEET